MGLKISINITEDNILTSITGVFETRVLELGNRGLVVVVVAKHINCNRKKKRWIKDEIERLLLFFKKRDRLKDFFDLGNEMIYINTVMLWLSYALFLFT